jgi:hypothetical protein
MNPAGYDAFRLIRLAGRMFMPLSPVLMLPGFIGLAAVASPPPFDLAGRTVLATLKGEGVQIYECKRGSDGARWTFREPVATLIEDGKTVGRHFAGPRWELEDTSLVQGRMVQSLPGASAQDVALLRLDVVSHAGHGRLDGVTAIYRLNTRGGVLKGACATPGAIESVPYSADYVFAR